MTRAYRRVPEAQKRVFEMGLGTLGWTATQVQANNVTRHAQTMLEMVLQLWRSLHKPESNASSLNSALAAAETGEARVLCKA